MFSTMPSTGTFIISAMVDAGEVESVPGGEIAPMADVLENTLKIEE